MIIKVLCIKEVPEYYDCIMFYDIGNRCTMEPFAAIPVALSLRGCANQIGVLNWSANQVRIDEVER